MMVTFVSECEKKALPRTRRVLDAFANRIGSRTWQTVITAEGLAAVKKLLRRTASKNTAVSCHWIRSRSRSELVWIVGNRRKFDNSGNIPVNHTRKTIFDHSGEENWQYLPLIKALTGLAALLHDWGKASEFFQWKLQQKGIIGDPLRHEWVSLLFFSVFVDQRSSDVDWLDDLIAGRFNAESIKTALQQKAIAYKADKRPINPFHRMPQAAMLLGWLIVTHHRLPSDFHNTKRLDDLQRFMRRITHLWGYQSRYDEAFTESVGGCFVYKKDLPSDSRPWVQAVSKEAKRLKANLPMLEQAMQDSSWRAILSHCRLALMLGDHYYSSLEPDSDKRVKHQELDLVANTDKQKNPKQTLDEHLLGVYQQSLQNAHFLKFFSGEKFQGEEVLRWASDLRSLKGKSPEGFEWQDKAVAAVKKWRKQESQSLDVENFGFFAVNMASTGRGKTFANAKIMQALSPNQSSLRFVLALGLRTLTLQTGAEYRDRVRLGKDDLAVLIGSRAILELHQKNCEGQSHHIEGDEPEYEGETGSYSEESLLDSELDFEGIAPLLEERLKTVLQNDKHRQFLYAPVLTCTIDHLMGATETKRGGRFILPTLRLMYSDLVIDEIDDFTGDDLIAIGRLIHLAGMLGRKVMISSATIPPDMAEGYFNAYQAGWSVYANMHKKSQMVGCAWIDEFRTNTASLQKVDVIADFRREHGKFIRDRNASLIGEVIRRKVEIRPLEIRDDEVEETLEPYYFQKIQEAIVEQHQHHAITDDKTSKRVSFGIVRMANIKPCIRLSRYLLNADWDEGVDVRVMAYHSQQLLIMRNAQEQHLDDVLKRKQGRASSLEHPLIRSHVSQTQGKHLIFILVATPVEEVGRDHSADWAVVEPSSFRSIIQLAGRVLRHEKLTDDIKQSNIALMQYNLKGLQGKEVAFAKPGYETKLLKLESKDLQQLFDEEILQKLQQRLDASLRVSRPDTLQYSKQLIDLEHESTHRALSDYEAKGAKPGHLQLWLESHWWLTAMPQEYVQFRKSVPSRLIYLYPLDGEWRFIEKSQWVEDKRPVEQELGIEQDETLTEKEQERLWLVRDYAELLEGLGKATLEEAALVYGELSLTEFGNKQEAYVYNSQFGLLRK